MSDWLEQYSAALSARDAREQAHKPYIDAYTRLADRTASLSTQPPPSAPKAPSSPRPASTKGRASGTPTKGIEQPEELLARLRTDLATTQKARAALQVQVDELAASLSELQRQDKVASTLISSLNKQKAELERRVRDREEELRGKAKLVVDAQDEMVALELQLNLSEERGEKLKKENRELVERWMKRMGEEAEKMNVESRWQ